MSIGKLRDACDTHDSRTFIRTGIIESAKRICIQVEHLSDAPCSTCVYNVAQLHAEFLGRLPMNIQAMPPAALCAAIRFAALDA